MKKSLIQLLDVLTFANRFVKLLAARPRETYRIRAKSVLDVMLQSDAAYSLVRYRAGADECVNKENILEGVSFEHARLTASAMAEHAEFVMVDPNIVRHAAGLDICAAASYMASDNFSFADQAEPFSSGRLLRESAAMTVAAVRALLVLIAAAARRGRLEDKQSKNTRGGNHD